MSKARAARIAEALALITAALGALPISTTHAVEPPVRFARNYPVTSWPHLSISCAYGDIAMTAWNRKELSVRAVGPPNVLVRDTVIGSVIAVSVIEGERRGKVDFEITGPPETSVHLRNRKGNMYVTGLTGHIEVNSGDGDIRLVHTRSSSIEARVICGDIFFDGDLAGDGPYTFQSLKGDVDITLSGWSSFRLSAHSMSDQINLGEFILNAIKRNRRSISGVHERGGLALNLVTYDGRVLLHKR